jgi:riboflavin kinase/FMN adenylyltransferase
VTNIGRRPTATHHVLRSETHILHWSGDIYGQRITVRLLAYLRPETRFESFAALKTQIHADAAQAEATIIKSLLPAYNAGE